MGPREFYEEIPSTQDRAIELARSGAPGGTRVRAARQTAGRGRFDHRWESPLGGLWLSVVLPAPSVNEALLPLALGASLLRELGSRFHLPIRLKWPNDLFVVEGLSPPRKLSGILVDRVPSPTLGTADVAGIGVNVAVEEEDLPEVLRGHVASLHRLVARAPSIDDVEEIAVTAALNAVHALTTPAGAAQVLAECRGALYGLGRRAYVDGELRGTIAGLGDDGELLLDEGLDRVPVRAGDLRVEETP